MNRARRQRPTARPRSSGASTGTFVLWGGGTDFFLGDDSFTLDGKPWPVPKKDFYVTTALTDHAARFIREERQAHPDKPFFLYLAYNAPHSPIEAPAAEMAKYRGSYLRGWDVIRRERFAKQQAIGLAGSGWHLPERPQNIPAWDALDDKSKDFEDLRMATYAAMVDCVDQGVGRVMQTLDELKLRDDTLVISSTTTGPAQTTACAVANSERRAPHGMSALAGRTRRARRSGSTSARSTAAA
ncbi:MAG: sulfatase-like hydrolase/transferase [Verrucomicrobiae bacterium]|nr:sulfatase-like hydrolase/transferase [Verrucomicrobiae bacterium]